MTHPATNPPEHVVAAAERQLRAHAISNELRAAEVSHDVALERTIAHFRLREQAWYQAQLGRARKLADAAVFS